MFLRKISSIFVGASILVLLGSSVLASTESSISGSVTDQNGIALPNLQVQLRSPEGKIIKNVQTSSTGTYQVFPVIIGEYEIFVAADGYVPFSTQVSVSSGGNSGVDAHLVSLASSSEMVVQVKAKKRLIQNTSAVSSSEINREQIVKLPQGQEASLPKMLAMTTPGVVQGPFGQTFFRGNHASIQYQLDGVQMPDSPSNTFAQTISPRNIDHMEVITGGIPAEFGQRLSAVLNVVTKSGTEKPEGEVELNYGSYNTFTPHLLYGGSNESGNLHYFFSANYNRTDRGLDTPQPESYENQKQGGKESIHNTATGNSEFAKIDWLIDNQNKLSLILFNSQSNFEIPNFPSTFKPSDPFFSQTGFTDAFGNDKGDDGTPTFVYRPANTNDTQSEINTYGQVVWKRTFSDRSFLQLAPYYKYSLIRIQNDPANDLSSATGPLPGFPTGIPGAVASSFAQNRHTNSVGLKGDFTLRADDRHLVKTGFQVQGSRSDGTVSIQTATQGGATASLTDDSPNSGYFQSVYVQDDFTIAKPLVLNAGLRFDSTQFVLAGERPTESMLQPRIGLNYMATDTTKFHIFYGKLFQPATIEHLRYQYSPSTGTFTGLESYNIRAEKDDFYEFGVAQQVFEKQVALLNIYYKDSVDVLDDAQVVNTSIAQPYNYDKGYAYGLELSLKGKLAEDWSEYVNYSYTIAKGKGAPDVPESQGYVFLDHVQVHTANAGLTYAKNYFWWTFQGLYGSGLRTGPFNSIQLPGHLTFDTTVGYEFHGQSWLSNFRLSGDILNILDNTYPITIANGFNGSHYAVGRQYFIRLAKSF
jgi:outer membrane receptor protein involved in Fe transport